jgi:hypothetical protein
MPAIVQVNVSVTTAPTPNRLQQTGAFISQGATTTTPGTLTLLTQISTLATYLTGAKAVSALTQTGGIATATTTAPHGFTVGDTVWLVISGANVIAYNGSFLCSITGASAFTYAVPAGTAASSPGTIFYTPEDVGELVAMNTTFFAQTGIATAVYVLELGAGNASDGVAFLTTWLANNPLVIYSFLVPRTWDGNASFLAFLANYNAASSMVNFFVTTTLQNYSLYTALLNSVMWMIESPAFGVWSANALTTASWAAATSNLPAQVTATTTTAHGVAVGQWFQISGVTPAAYNGWFQAQTGTTASTLVYNLPTNPGSETVLGTLLQSQYANAGIPSSEFSHASDFFVTLSWNPSTASRVPPLTYAFVYGVTPFPTMGTNALITQLIFPTGNGSIIGTGAEGGISNTIILGGTTADQNSFNFWYSVDWANITCNLNVSNYIINGSNNSVAPVYYDQNGINGGQTVIAATMLSGISYGLVFGSILQTALDPVIFANNTSAGTYEGYAVVNAVPFATYNAINVSAYKQRSYGGYSVGFTPQNGFNNIVINLNASQFVG